jgi:hypothetical protein
MASAYQTACPLCKHPLYTIHDKLLLFINKTTLCLQTTTFLLHFLVFWDEVQHFRYVNIVLEASLLVFMGWMTMNAYIPLIKQGGDNW